MYIIKHEWNVMHATRALKAKRLLPVHSAKLVLERHPWDELPKAITRLAQKNKLPLLTPMIEEPVSLNDTTQEFKEWWAGIN